MWPRPYFPLVFEPQRGVTDIQRGRQPHLARGIEAIDLRVVGRIFVSWVVTIPAGAILAIVFFYVFRAVLP